MMDMHIRVCVRLSIFWVVGTYLCGNVCDCVCVCMYALSLCVSVCVHVCVYLYIYIFESGRTCIFTCAWVRILPCTRHSGADSS